jgi:hypothetical protein
MLVVVVVVPIRPWQSFLSVMGEAMARKPTDVVQVNLRLRERLRRKLEQAARKRQVSLNYEMMWRLEQSFEQISARSIDDIARDLEVSYLRHQQPFHYLATQNGLRDAAERLMIEIERMPAECREHDGMQSAVAEVRKWFTVMDIQAAQAVRSVKH